MSVFTKTAVDIFAAQDSSGAKRKVANHDVQVWGTEVERAIKSFQAGGGVVFDSKTEADGSLDYNAYTMAWVFDVDPDKAGIYQKQGASGSGSWQRVGDLPYSFILATNTNSGNPNAIEATTPVAIPAADGGALIALPIVAGNTSSPVTVSFNGGAPLTIKTIAGRDTLSPGALASGMVVWGFKDGGDFRLVTDLSSAAIQAAAEAAADTAEAAAQSAALSSAAAGAASGRLDIADFSQLATDFVYDNPGPGQQQVAAGDVIVDRKRGFAWLVAADDANDAHIDYSGSGGIKLYALGQKMNPLAFGARDGTDVTEAAQKALAAVPQGGTLTFEGLTDIILSAPVERTGWSGVVDLAGVRILNDFDRTEYPRGTTAALFKFAGSREAVGTIDGDFTRGSVTFDLDTGSLAPGDEIGFTGGAGPYTGAMNICRVVSVSGSTVTVDRPAHTTISSGAAVYKRDPVTVAVLGQNTYIDFNGSTDDPRYGFGVLILYGSGCLVKDIKGDYCGSKIVEFSGCIDCTEENISGRMGTDLAGDGGHSYVTRLSTSNDCVVRSVHGTRMRHTVDLTAASRNKIIDCSDCYSHGVAYLTHGNGCVDNIFTNCDCERSQVAAYSFNEADGDLYNTVVGGTVVDTTLLYGWAGETNVAIGVRWISRSLGKAMFAPIASTKHVYKGCVFESTIAALQTMGSGLTVTVIFDGCHFKLSGLRALASLTTTQHVWRIIFDHCSFDVDYTGGQFIDGNENVTFEFINPTIRASGDANSGNITMINGVGSSIIVDGGSAQWGSTSSPGYIFAMNDGLLEIGGGFKARNAGSGLVRRVGGTPELRIGDVDLGVGLAAGSVPFTAANMAVTTTFGKVANLGYTSAPASGTWSDGCKVANESPSAGGYMGWARISGGWKGIGAIEA